MPIEELIRKRLKKLKQAHPGIDTERIEHELIPLQLKDELQPRVGKKKKHEL